MYSEKDVRCDENIPEEYAETMEVIREKIAISMGLPSEISSLEISRIWLARMLSLPDNANFGVITRASIRKSKQGD